MNNEKKRLVYILRGYALKVFEQASFPRVSVTFRHPAGDILQRSSFD